jgi:imidazolonepropionase-like amidohydrolase
MLTIITNGRLLDCITDGPLENSSVVIEEGVIKDVYTGRRSITRGATVIDVGGKTVMPGLTDAHDHPACTQVNPEKRRTEPPLYIALNMKGNLERLLQAGFTTIRDMGRCHWSLKQAVDDGLIIGPRLLIACSFLSPTGGHGDPNLHGEQLFYNDLGRLRKGERICDGEADCRKATREQFRNGADHIKIFATGGCFSPNDEPWHRQFCEAEIRVIVEEAESVGLYVGAHCQEDQGIRSAIECGVRTIEHGPFMSEQTARLMKERGAFLVPTLSQPWWVMAYGKEVGAPEWFMRKIKEPMGPGKPDILEAQVISMQLARKIGIPVGSGADYLCSQMIGGEAMELKLKTEGGMTPYEAIKSATIINAKIFRMEDRIGSIEVGKWADIIAVEGHPDEDINVLVNPSNIRLVMRKGNVFKNIL